MLERKKELIKGFIQGRCTAHWEGSNQVNQKCGLYTCIQTCSSAIGDASSPLSPNHHRSAASKEKSSGTYGVYNDTSVISTPHSSAARISAWEHCLFKSGAAKVHLSLLCRDKTVSVSDYSKEGSRAELRQFGWPSCIQLLGALCNTKHCQTV